VYVNSEYFRGGADIAVMTRKAVPNLPEFVRSALLPALTDCSICPDHISGPYCVLDNHHNLVVGSGSYYKLRTLAFEHMIITNDGGFRGLSGFPCVAPSAHGDPCGSLVGMYTAGIWEGDSAPVGPQQSVILPLRASLQGITFCPWVHGATTTVQWPERIHVYDALTGCDLGLESGR
jgi:hypothetical protein